MASGVFEPHVARGGLDHRFPGDTAELDVAGSRAHGGRADNGRELHVAACRLCGGIALELFELDISGRRFRLERAQPPPSANVRRRGRTADVGALRSANRETDVDLSPEPEAAPAPVIDVDDHFVSPWHFAQFDPSLLEQVRHLVVATANVELDLGRRARRARDVDAAGGDANVERDLARSLERLAPHDRRPRTRRMTSSAPGGPILRGARGSTPPELTARASARTSHELTDTPSRVAAASIAIFKPSGSRSEILATRASSPAAGGAGSASSST